MVQFDYDILFFAEYPFDKVNEGMAQRILQIDKGFLNQRRVYLHCSLKYFKKFKRIKVGNNVEQLYLNPIFSYWQLNDLLRRSKFFYLHSVYNYISIFFISFRKKSVILDIHGIVPEELAFGGMVFKSRVYGWLERFLFSRIHYAICVSHKMKQYMVNKYPRASESINFVILPIVQSNEIGIQPFLPFIGPDDVVFIYSGGLQKWQNIPLMLQCIEELTSPSYFFLLLTQNPSKLKELISHLPLQGHRILVRSASKRELPYYYLVSHYGFLLRDSHVLNEVSAPTKMFEYLENGITPILLSEEIGDYASMEIDKLSIHQLSNSMTSCKSDNNIKQAHLLRKQASIDLWSIISSS